MPTNNCQRRNNAFLYVSASSTFGLARLVSTRLFSFRFLFRLDLWLVDDSCAMPEITTAAAAARAGNGAGVGPCLC